VRHCQLARDVLLALLGRLRIPYTSASNIFILKVDVRNFVIKRTKFIVYCACDTEVT
jgi:hypothetical protein